jgi:superfamily II DNA/RNA helicase
VNSRSKVEVLCRLLDIENPRLAILFANTKRMVDDVTDALMARGFAVVRGAAGIVTTRASASAEARLEIEFHDG